MTFDSNVQKRNFKSKGKWEKLTDQSLQAFKKTLRDRANHTERLQRRHNEGDLAWTIISLVSSLVLFGVGGRAFPNVLIKTTRGSWRSVKDLKGLSHV